jgi:DNA-binding GntR family transcriptional regulator
MQRLIDQHEAIVDAIEIKNCEQADKAIRYHMQEVLRDLPDIVAQYPELFRKSGVGQSVVDGAM